MKEDVSGKVEIPRSETWIMHSRAENRKYQIFAATPDEAPPPSGFPVVYVLDGNSIFATWVEAVRLQGRRPDKTGVVASIVVGIGYAAPFPAVCESRYYDLTPASNPDCYVTPDGVPLPEQGGAAAFSQFIAEELQPEIERRFSVDRNRRMIFGHSLGGLFVLHMLFNNPSAFQCFAACSPSIHWCGDFMLEEERRFMSRLERQSVNVKVLLAAGELEKGQARRVNENARELYERLSILRSRGVRAAFKEFEGEGHGSVILTSISYALRYALADHG